MVGKRLCDEVWGWGEVISDEGNYLLVRFDGDPLGGLHRYPKDL